MLGQRKFLQQWPSRQWGEQQCADSTTININLLPVPCCAVALACVLQDGDIMQLMQMEVDADSQHTVELLTKSASLHTAPSGSSAGLGLGLGLAPAGSSDVGRAVGGTRGPSNLRHASGPAPAGQQDGGAGAGAGAGVGSRPGGSAAAAAGGFSFKMFGKELGAGGGNGGGGGNGSSGLQVGGCCVEGGQVFGCMSMHTSNKQCCPATAL